MTTKDFLGNELVPGDKVIYTLRTGLEYKIGIVSMIYPDRVILEVESNHGFMKREAKYLIKCEGE